MPATANYQPQTNDPGLSFPSANVRRPGDFPAEEFIHIPDVPVFDEHQTTARNGQPLAFGYHELAAVVARCNRRITETGDYAAVCIGHTPSPEAVESGTAIMPEMVGYAGPWKIGQSGFAAKRWTVLADFWIFKADIAKFKKHPRRSAELWLEDKYEDMFLDPIALLGAETPRLDMGLLYSAVRSGKRIVEKYAAAAAAPGPTSVFIPSAGGDQRKYSSLGASSMALAPEDVGQIIDALMQTEPMQFLMSQMAQQGAAGGQPPGAVPPPGAGLDAPGGEPGLDAPGGAPPAAPAAPPPAAPAGPPAAPKPPAAAGPPKPPGGPPAAKPPGKEPEKNMADGTAPTFSSNTTVNGGEKVQYAAGEDEMPEEERAERETYAALCKKYGAGSVVPADGAEAKGGSPSVENAVEQKPTTGDADGAEKIKYSKLERQVSELAANNKQMQAQLQTERSSRVNAERYSKLAQLHSQGYSFDLEKNAERVQYSKMSDEVFTNHIQTLIETAPQAPLDRELVVYDNVPGMSSGQPKMTTGEGGRREVAKYGKEVSEKALKHCLAMSEQGKPTDYETVLEQVAAGKL